MVNEKFEIIDGQHRYLICKELDLPINYIIEKKYGLREVQILNANMKNWTANDYVNGYCDLGYKDYQVYRDFVKKYGFTNQVALLLLSGEFVSGSSNDTITSKFKEGEFKVKDLDKSKKLAERIKSIEPYYNGYLRRSFIYAIVGMLKKDIFNFEEFLSKLKHQPTVLKDCANVTQYKELIEEIYNHRRREKINLRY